MATKEKTKKGTKPKPKKAKASAVTFEKTTEDVELATHSRSSKWDGFVAACLEMDPDTKLVLKVPEDSEPDDYRLNVASVLSRRVMEDEGAEGYVWRARLRRDRTAVIVLCQEEEG